MRLVLTPCQAYVNSLDTPRIIGGVFWNLPCVTAGRQSHREVPCPGLEPVCLVQGPFIITMLCC